MAVIKGEYVCESLLVDGFTSTMWAGKNDSVLLASMSAEVNDVWLVSQEQALQIAWLCGWMFVKLELVAVWTFMNPFINLSGFFIHQNPAVGPRTCGDK